MTTTLRNAAYVGAIATFGLLAVASGGTSKSKDGDAGASVTTTSASGKNVVASCDLRALMGSCEEHHDDTFFLEMSKKGCEGLARGTDAKGWSKAACAQDSVLGTCSSSDSTQLLYFPMHTLKTAEQSCKGEIAPHTWKASGKTFDGPRASCTNPGKDCTEWGAASTDGWEQIRMVCSNVKGQLTPGRACETDKVLAKCVRPDGTTELVYAKEDVGFHKSLCAAAPGVAAGVFTIVGAAKPAAGAKAKR